VFYSSVKKDGKV